MKRISHTQKAGEMFSTALKLKSRGGCWSAHGLVCLFGFLGHSARAGQTLAKEAIKVKKSAVDKTSHCARPFSLNSLPKIQVR